MPHEPLRRRRPARERDPDERDDGDLRDSLENGEDVCGRSRQVLRAAPRRPPERRPERLVEREQHACADALDLQRPAELASDGVEHAVRGDQQEREVREHDRSGRERDDHGELAPAAPSPGDDAEQGQEQHRVELDRDPDTDDERACPKAARGEQCQRAGDEGGGEKVEPREDHAAEESGDEGDGGERDVPVGDRTVETAQPLAHEQDTERPDNGHLGHEDRTIGARGVGHERRQHESGQTRPGGYSNRKSRYGTSPSAIRSPYVR